MLDSMSLLQQQIQIPENRPAIRDAMLSLRPPRRAQAAELYYFGKVPQKALAKAFGITQNTTCFFLIQVANTLVRELGLHA